MSKSLNIIALVFISWAIMVLVISFLTFAITGVEWDSIDVFRSFFAFFGLFIAGLFIKLLDDILN